jgi:hypothetical protein
MFENTVRLVPLRVNCPEMVQRPRPRLQALFFDVTAEKVDQRCSTLWPPQSGHFIVCLSCSAMVKIFENVFLQV